MKTLDGRSRDPDNRRMFFILNAVKVFPLSKQILHKHIKDQPLINEENGKPFALATYNRDLDYLKHLGFLELDRASRYSITEKGKLWLSNQLASQGLVTAGPVTS